MISLTTGFGMFASNDDFGVDVVLESLLSDARDLEANVLKHSKDDVAESLGEYTSFFMKLTGAHLRSCLEEAIREAPLLCVEALAQRIPLDDLVKHADEMVIRIISGGFDSAKLVALGRIASFIEDVQTQRKYIGWLLDIHEHIDPEFKNASKLWTTMVEVQHIHPRGRALLDEQLGARSDVHCGVAMARKVAAAADLFSTQ